MTEERDIRPVIDPCAWCGADAFEELITSKPRHKRTTAPACPQHIKHFARTAGMETVGQEISRKHGGDR